MRFQRLIVTMIGAVVFWAPAAMAQSASAEAAEKPLLPAKEKTGINIWADASASCLKNESAKGRAIPAENFHKKQFLVLSAGVYTASLADMYETARVRNEQWWYERDPLAKPIVRLPAPAYYATGLALATGVNWVSWRTEHSRRWQKLAFLPQLFSIAGNSYGFRSNY